MSQARDGAETGLVELGRTTSQRNTPIRTGDSRVGLRRGLLRRTGIAIVLAGLAGCDTVSETYDDVVGWLDGDDETAPPPARNGFADASAVPPAPTETAEDRRQRLRRELAGDTTATYSGESLTAQGATPATPQTGAPQTGTLYPAPATPGTTTYPAPASRPAEPAGGLQPLFDQGGGMAPQTAAGPATGTTVAPAYPAPTYPAQTYPSPTGGSPAGSPGYPAPQTADAGGYGIQPLFGNTPGQPAGTAYPQAPVPSQLPTPPTGMGGQVAGAPGFGAAPAADASLQNTTDPYIAYYGRTQSGLVPQEPSPVDTAAPAFDRTSRPQTASAGPVPLQPAGPAGQPATAQQPRPTFGQQVPSALPVQATPTTAFGSPVMNRRTAAPAAIGGQMTGRPGYASGRLLQTVSAPAMPIARAGRYFNGRRQQAGTIYFGNGSAGLDANDRRVIRQIADIYRRRGGGLIQIVGHASHRTRQLDPMRHRLANFEISLRRGAQVKQALQRLGIDPRVIAVAAESDRQPVFRENMPSGEAGNRRANIFFVD